jgi:dihydroorotase
MNNQVMRRAMEYSRTFDALILDHCEDKDLASGAVMREGELSTRLGLAGWPAAAESIQVARDVTLAEYTGARVHICHVSTVASIQFIRHGKARGVRISGEVSPHHLALTVDRLATYDTHAKCNPPLGTEEDRQALIEALRDGTLEVIATDHAPHTQIEKDYMFTDAPNGVIGMETAYAVLNTALIRPGVLPLALVIEKLTINPARLLRVNKGTLSDGADADVAIFDPEARWTVDPEKFQSKARNCPWNGEELIGRPVMTFAGGRMVWREGKITV